MARPEIESDPLSLLHPAVASWFRERFTEPTIAQARAWPAAHDGRHVLLAAPTGSGKTLAAFLAAIDALVREGTSGALPDETRVLYVSPLRALSNDVEKNLMVPLAGMAGLALLSPVAQAHPQTTPPTDPGGSGESGETVADELAPVDVLQVSGLFDEVTVESIHDALERAERTGSQALILQLNTGGAIVGDDEMRDLIVAVRDSPVAVGLWGSHVLK